MPFSLPFPMGSEALASRWLRILAHIAETGQHEAHRAAVDQFVERVLAVTDDDRRVVAARRRGLDEAFREKAVRAGAESLARHPELYVQARMRVAGAHPPACLEEGELGAEGSGISRLVPPAGHAGLPALGRPGTLP